MSDRTVGFIGLGNMGAPIAGHLVQAGYDVICSDVAGAERAPSGATFVASAAEVAHRCSEIVTSLPDSAVVGEVLAEVITVDNRRTELFIDASTIGVAPAERHARQAAAAGFTYLDAPVSGGVAGAVAGTIAVMCGGSRAAFERCQPLLSSFAGNVFHVGEAAGMGQAMKVLNNFLSGTAMAATSEAIAFGQRAGLDLETMLAVLNVSSGQNTATADKFPREIVPGTLSLGFRVDQLLKDLRLYATAADGLAAARWVSPAVIDAWQRLSTTDERADIAAIFPLIASPPTDSTDD